jgi:hypothetical protein
MGIEEGDYVPPGVQQEEAPGGQAALARQIAQKLAYGDYSPEARGEFVRDLIENGTLPLDEIEDIARLLD